jgi:spermidine synthase
MFAQVHENSIYSFSVVVAVFLAGLAGGAFLARTLLRRGKSPARLLGIAWTAGGFAVLVSPHLFLALTDGLTYLNGDGGWSSYGARLLWLAFPTVLAPVLLAGMAFPPLMELAGRSSEQSAGRILGWLLAINTAGSILLEKSARGVVFETAQSQPKRGEVQMGLP